MLTTADLPSSAHAVADPGTAGARYGRGASRALTSRIDWWRVGVLALVATGHIVGIGLMALPDTAATPNEPIQRRMAEVSDNDRLTLFVDLEPAPAPPLQPLPPTPVRLLLAPIRQPAPVATAVPSMPVVTDAPMPISVPDATPIVASAPPTPVDATAAANVAPVPSPPSRRSGDPAQIRSDRDAYMRALMAALLQHRSYPPEARKQRARGIVHVRFSVDRDGHVLASSIARGAGFEILEAAALDVLRSAEPLPPIPESLGVDRLTVTVPIEYSLITR